MLMQYLPGSGVSSSILCTSFRGFRVTLRSRCGFLHLRDDTEAHWCGRGFLTKIRTRELWLPGSVCHADSLRLSAKGVFTN